MLHSIPEDIQSVLQTLLVDVLQPEVHGEAYLAGIGELGESRVIELGEEREV